ncbi:hypothetical protein [Rhizobium phage RHph_X2_26]|nr:hypothetical protein [Rhizobium phage RHph_X2_26]
MITLGIIVSALAAAFVTREIILDERYNRDLLAGNLNKREGREVEGADASPEEIYKYAVGVAQNLEGSCRGFSDALDACGVPQEVAKSTAFLQEVDDRVFECECCGWWADAADARARADYGPVCAECAP